MKNGSIIDHKHLVLDKKEKLYQEKPQKSITQNIKDKNMRQEYRIQVKHKKYEMQQKES